MLKRASGGISAPFSLAFLTDRRRIADPEPILRALPKGAAVIYRDYEDPGRASVAGRYASICKGRGVLFLVGGDMALARKVGADGVHYPSRLNARIRPAAGLIVTAACHDAEDLTLAHARGADLALLSPAFATASHPDTDHLGPARFRALAGASLLPVLGLGGVTAENAATLAGRNVAGLAAIGAFLSAG